MESIRILVVDDSATDRLILQEMLQGYDVVTANNGLDALRLLDAQTDISLILLDLSMPVMNGFQVLEALGKDQRFRGIRTLVLTNYAEPENEIRGLSLGAVDFIRKPIHMDILKVRIDVHATLIRMQRKLEQEMHKQALAFNQIFDQVPVGIAVSFNATASTEEENRYLSINPMLEKITGRTKAELLKLGWAAITHPDDLAMDMDKYEMMLSGKIDRYELDKRYIKPDGSIVWVHILVSSLDFHDSDRLNHISIVMDITAQKETEKALQESERSKSVLLSHMPGMAYRCKYDRDWTMMFVSDGCLALTGYPPESLLGNKVLSFNDLILPAYRDALWNEWAQDLEKHAFFRHEYEIRTAAGEQKWVLEMGQGVFDEQGEVEALEGIIFDISTRKAFESRLKYSSEHDRLTGLYNYDYLENLLGRDLASDVSTRRVALDDSVVSGEPAAPGKRAVVSLNLTSIHALTAVYGYRYSQNLLKGIVEILKPHVTETRLLFSTFENKFAFYVRDYADFDELSTFCEVLGDALRERLSTEGVGCGIGVVEIRAGKYQQADQILKHLMIISEIAMDMRERELRVCYFDDRVESRIHREQVLRHELMALCGDAGDGGLHMAYQPILDASSSRVVAFEALARLNSEELGPVPPLEFIPMAEKNKLIVPLGQKIILQALRFAKRLEENGFSGICVFINVSILQLLQRDFTHTLFATLQDMAVSPRQVGLELTESIFYSNLQEINRTLSRLREAGIRISIDDFGTGYSSLSRERELEIDYLKIDKSFVTHLLDSSPDTSIIPDIISMAHRFGHEVVAEGVEEQTQQQLLAQWGCDKLQGYLFSRPVDVTEALRYLVP